MTMRLLLACFTLFFSLSCLAADYAREQRWADQIEPSVLVGDPVWIKQANGHKFLGLYTTAANAKAGLVIVHGIGVHPDWGLIGALRQQLPDDGYTTLSIQMPVLEAEAKPEDYPPTFAEAAERIRLAVAFLKDKGYAKVAIVSHSLGTWMSYYYLTHTPDSPVVAWVDIGAPNPFDMAKLKLPILDLYGQNDLPRVLEGAKQRAAGLKQKGSLQVMVPGADHFFTSQEAALHEQIRTWLDKTLADQ
jgi:pimeloyl-ACP methyl ester carboxylesterase